MGATFAYRIGIALYAGLLYQNSLEPFIVINKKNGFKYADLTYWELVTFGLFFVELYINFTQMNSHEIRENTEKI